MEEQGANTLKLVGEIFVPGASQLIEGNVGSGAAHLVLGSLAVAVLVPAAPVLAGLLALGVRLNSFSSSLSGKNLWDHTEARKAEHGRHKAAGNA